MRRVLWLAKGLGPGGMERLLETHARFGNRDKFEYFAAYLVERPNSVVGWGRARTVGGLGRLGISLWCAWRVGRATQWGGIPQGSPTVATSRGNPLGWAAGARWRRRGREVSSQPP